MNVIDQIANFFLNLDWDGFWLNFLVSAIFFILSVFVSIKLIPYFTIRLIHRKNKKFIDRRTSAIVQEISRFLNRAPYRDQELHQKNLSIFSSNPGDKNYRFVGFVKINVLSEILRIKIFIIVSEHFKKMNVKERYESLKKEKARLVEFRTHIENIIGYHSLHLDEEIISEVSEICLDIRSFELVFEFNQVTEELFQKEGKEMPGVSGVGEVAKIYEKLFEVLNRIIEKSKFTTEVKK